MIIKTTLKVLTVAALLSTSLTACTSSLLPGQGVQQSDFGGIQGQEAVPDEYIIKRKGVSYLTAPEEFAQQYPGLLFVREIEGLGVELFKVSNPAVLDEIRDQIDYAEPNYLRHLSLPAQSSIQSQSVFRRQTADAGATLPAGNNYIGLIDTGVDITHPDLQGKLLAGHNTLGLADVQDDNGHGTFLAGVAVGSNTQQQLDGVLPDGKILPIKALDANGIGTDFSIAEGIMIAVEYGAQVIVLSATGANQSQALTAAMDYANQHNVPVVVPSGNQMDAASVFPGNSRSVLSVNSANATGQGLSAFARSTPNVTISAVAQGVRSTLPLRGFSLSRMGLSSGYGQLETPGAAAMKVAAALAGIKTMNPGIRLPELRAKLVASADKLPQAGAGSGRLNIASVARTAGVNAQSVPRPAQPVGYGSYPAATGYPQQVPAYPQTAYPQTGYPAQQAYPQQAYAYPAQTQRRGY